jgi:16S rRNA (guanine966-N2)-methyltransferase
VVAGSARGRPLDAPPGTAVRPTTDRVRESVCNSLGSLGALEGAVVLDLFAGSGALGVEALSRGAASATFVDSSAAALAAVRANVERCGFVGRSRLVRSDGLAHLAQLAQARDVAGGRTTGHDTTGSARRGDRGGERGDEPFVVAPPGPEVPTLVFCDPPYDFDRWDELLGAIAAAAPGAVVVAESDRAVSAGSAGEVLRDRRHGGTVVTTIRIAGARNGRPSHDDGGAAAAGPASPPRPEDPS